MITLYWLPGTLYSLLSSGDCLGKTRAGLRDSSLTNSWGRARICTWTIHIPTLNKTPIPLPVLFPLLTVLYDHFVSFDIIFHTRFLPNPLLGSDEPQIQCISSYNCNESFPETCLFLIEDIKHSSRWFGVVTHVGKLLKKPNFKIDKWLYKSAADNIPCPKPLST